MSLDYQGILSLIERLDMALKRFASRMEKLQGDEPMEHFLKANEEGRTIEEDGSQYGSIFLDPADISAVETHGMDNKLTTIHLKGGQSFDVRMPKEKEFKRLVRQPEKGDEGE